MRLGKTVTALAVVLLGAVPLPAQNQVNLTVDATMDIYRAGGYNDGSNGIAPVVFSFPARAWRTMTFPSVGGAWTCSSTVPQYGPDGTSLSTGCLPPSGNIMNATGTFSGYDSTDFTGAMVGMFLEDALPPAAPAALRFYNSDSSQGGIPTDFKNLNPLIGQVFFIGDGLTGTGLGSIQVFDVPLTATHLYLGYVDSCNGGPVPGCYSGNPGSLNVSVRLQYWVPDWVEPTLSSAPSARALEGIAYDAATGSTVLFGGGNARWPGGVVYGDTWIWRRGWSQLSPASSPSARSFVGMAYDPSTGTAVLFGGQDANGVVFGDTWTWDGVTWTQQFPPTSPPARSGTGAMVYNPATDTVVLFGGLGTSTGGYGAPVFGDTWEWNGKTKTWTQDFPASSPSPRVAPVAYDPITKTVVLFSGDNGAGDCCNVYYDDTWTWDGVTWTQQFPATSPSARAAHSMAYDASLGQVVMFGGFSVPGQGLNDTWAWSGKTWTRLKATQPTGLWATPMDFDPLSGGLFFFGGQLTGDIVTNNTWLLTPVPVP